MSTLYTTKASNAFFCRWKIEELLSAYVAESHIATSGMDWSYFCHNYSCCESCLQSKDTPQHQLCTDNNRVLSTTFNHLILLHFQCCCHTTQKLIDIIFVKLHNILLPWCGLRILRPSPQQTTSNGLIPHPVEVPHTLIIHSRQYSYYFEANCQTQCGGQDNNAEVRWGHCRGCFWGHDDIYL